MPLSEMIKADAIERRGGLIIVPITKRYRHHRETEVRQYIRRWLDENCSGMTFVWNLPPYEIIFGEEEDAVLFSMTFA